MSLDPVLEVDVSIGGVVDLSIPLPLAPGVEVSGKGNNLLYSAATLGSLGKEILVLTVPFHQPSQLL